MIQKLKFYNPSSIFYFPFSIFLRSSSLVLLLVLLLITSCKTSLQIEKHLESYNGENINLKYSYINIPVELDVKSMEKLVNKQLTGLIYSDTSFSDNGNDNLMLKAWKSGEIQLSMTKNDLFYKVPLRIWVNKRFEISSFGLTYSDNKEVNAEIALKFKTHLSLNKNWTFSTLTTSDGYEWITTPQLKLGPVNFPITYLADVLVKSNQKILNTEIDKSLASLLDLRQSIQKIWTDIQKPIKVSDDYPIWARITPVELSTVPLTGTTTGVINQSIGIKAITELFYGSEPDYKLNATIPEIKILSRLDNSFVINLPIDLPFSQINEVANKQMKGYKITQGKYSITIDDVNIYGNDEDLVVAAKVSGSVNGTIYLAGKPFYSKDSSTISIRELDFDLKTKNVLHKSASWIFKHGLVETLQKKLVFKVGQQLEETRREVRSYLEQNRKLEMFTVSGKIQHLDLDGILITKKSLKVVVAMEGKLNVRMVAE